MLVVLAGCVPVRCLLATGWWKIMIEYVHGAKFFYNSSTRHSEEMTNISKVCCLESTMKGKKLTEGDKSCALGLPPGREQYLCFIWGERRKNDLEIWCFNVILLLLIFRPLLPHQKKNHLKQCPRRQNREFRFFSGGESGNKKEDWNVIHELRFSNNTKGTARLLSLAFAFGYVSNINMAFCRLGGQDDFSPWNE